MSGPLLHWRRGRVEDGSGAPPRTVEWIGIDDAGNPIARVVRVQGPLHAGWRLFHAVALDEDARVVELRPTPPRDADWLACIGGQVVGRAALPLQAVRQAETALLGTR
jgi:hypothetical protein